MQSVTLCRCPYDPRVFTSVHIHTHATLQALMTLIFKPTVCFDINKT